MERIAAIKSLITAGVLSALAGCVSYQPKPLDLRASNQALASQALNNVSIQQRLQSLQLLNEGWPLPSWNRAQLLVAATERNPTLLTARAHLEAASAATTTARSLPNPTLSLGSEYDLSQSSESPWLWSITTDWLLDVGLRRQLRVQLADTAVRVARLDYAEAVWTVRSELRTALLAVLLNEQRSILLSEAISEQETLLRHQQQRIAQGEAATPDALPIEMELTRMRTASIDSQRQVNAARVQLATALGVSITALQSQQFQWQDLFHVMELDDAAIAKLRDSALLARADLEHEVLNYQSRELELHQAVRQQYPQLSIGPGYTWDHGVHKATLGVSFSLPVFNRNQGPIAEALAQRESAGQQVLAVQFKVFNEIDSARQAYDDSVQSLQTIVQQSDALEAALQQTDKAARLGAVDQSTLIAARLVFNTQKLSVLDAVERMQTSLGQLEDALRTPLSGPETTLGAAVLADPTHTLNQSKR